MSSATEKALHLLRYLPRISLNNLSPNPYFKKKVLIIVIINRNNNNYDIYIIE